MYEPKEANKTYMTLLKENGLSAGLKSLFLVLGFYFYNVLIVRLEPSVANVIGMYFFFCIYFSFKSKFVRFLRGYLRSEEFRNKAD